MNAINCSNCVHCAFDLFASVTDDLLQTGLDSPDSKPLMCLWMSLLRIIPIPEKLRERGMKLIVAYHSVNVSDSPTKDGFHYDLTIFVKCLEARLFD